MRVSGTGVDGEKGINVVGGVDEHSWTVGDGVELYEGVIGVTVVGTGDGEISRVEFGTIEGMGVELACSLITFISFFVTA